MYAKEMSSAQTEDKYGVSLHCAFEARSCELK